VHTKVLIFQHIKSKIMTTINGFTLKEEIAILKDIKELEKNIKSGKIQKLNSVKEMMKDLTN